MKIKEILKEMFLLQQKLNDETNGKGWENGYTKEKKIINWKRCIYMECAELLDSFSWKHWKNINAEPNWENIRVEIVDIWHFILSLVLEEYHVKNESFEKLLEDVSSVSNFNFFCNDACVPDSSNQMEIINDIESLINQCSSFGVNLGEILSIYYVLALKCGINLEILYSYYIAKNILNKFRQDNGYKEGTYKKIWQGKEDNVVMLELMEQKLMNSEELYKALKKEYSKVK